MSSVMELCSSAMRGCLAAAPGKKLCVADLANIEGRMLAWLAGEEWLLQAFRDYDKGIGADLYKVTYAKAFGIPVEQVTKEQRQLGKVLCLAMGYSGGVGAFVAMAVAYQMDLTDVAKAVLKIVHTLPTKDVEDAERFWIWSEEQGRTLGLEKDVFVACDLLKRGWRRAHPNIVKYWKDTEEGLHGAIQNPGTTFKVGRVKMRRDGSWVRIQMPSGRHLCYYNARVDEDGQITYQGINPYTRSWERVKTYSGKCVENETQFAARDVLAHSMPLIEKAGYSTVLTVHDELITEAPDTDEYSHEEVARIMAIVPPWAEGLPLAAEGFTDYRYRK